MREADSNDARVEWLSRYFEVGDYKTLWDVFLDDDSVWMHYHAVGRENCDKVKTPDNLVEPRKASLSYTILYYSHNTKESHIKAGPGWEIQHTTCSYKLWLGCRPLCLSRKAVRMDQTGVPFY
jgi:hypothetical protein